MSSNFPIHHGIRLATDGFIVNARVEQLANDPVILDIGRIWYNTTEQVFKIVVDDGTGAGVKRTIGTQEAITLLQTEINSTQSGAGLGSDGSYVVNGSANYIASSTSLADADNDLDAALKAEETARIAADSALQSELDQSQSAAGLNANGTFSAPIGTNYLGSATTLKGADVLLDSAIKAEETRAMTAEAAIQAEVDAEEVARANADTALQAEIDAEEVARAAADSAIHSAAGLSSAGAYTAPVGTNYLGSATTLKGADVLLDAAIKAEETRALGAESDLAADITAEETRALAAEADLAADIVAEETRAMAAESALDGRLSTVEGSYIKKDGTVSMTGNLNLDSHLVKNVATPVDSGDAVNKAYVDAIATAIGSAFNYVGVIAGGADAGSAVDMALQTENDVGDYYKVSTAGYFKHSTVTAAFFANVNDGIVFNTTGGIDKIDSTDSSVTGTSDYIAVTGSTDTGFTVDIAAAFKTRMSDAEQDILDEVTRATGAEAGLAADITAEETRALAAEAGLAADITAEETRALAAEAALDADITAEENARIAAVAAVQAEVDAEEVRALAAEAALQAEIDAEETARANADTALQSELDQSQSAAGLNANGTYTAPAGTNYLTAATTLKGADVLLDTAIKAEETRAMTAESGLSADITAEETRAMAAEAALDADIVAEETRALAAEAALDADITAEETRALAAEAAIQGELNTTQTGAGLNANGSYAQPSGTNYLDSTTSLANADVALDTKIKALLTAINDANYYVEKSTAATEHTIEHGLNSSAITFTVMVDRDGSGDWRNDVVSVKHTDNNTLTVYLSVAKKVRVSVQKVADISI